MEEDRTKLLSAEKYALESMDSGVLLVNRGGDIIYANETAKSIFKLRASACVRYRDLFFTEDGSNDNMIDLITESIFEPGEKKERVLHYKDPEGQKRVLLFYCTKLKTDEDIYVLTFSDQTELYKSSIRYRDSTVILSLLFAITGLWSVLVAFWEWKGRFVAADSLTTWIEVIGVAMIIVFVKASSLTIRDMGLSVKNWKETLWRSGIRVVILWAVFAVAKLVVLKVKPEFFAQDAPFWDWKQADIRLLTYLLTALIQEFLARGGCQEALTRILPGKHKDYVAIGLTSLFFMSLHLQRGLPFMLGAGALSIILGLIYKKDRNIFGVVLIHYCFGKFADFFRFL